MTAAMVAASTPGTLTVNEHFFWERERFPDIIHPLILIIYYAMKRS